MRVTQSFDASTSLSIDPELCRRVDLAQDRELAERPFDFTQGHELVEWQMGVLRQPLKIQYRARLHFKSRGTIIAIFHLIFPGIWGKN
jgi:hypothetical protein